jgi:hypothetical protein
MTDDITPGWRFLSIGFEKDPPVFVDSVDIWTTSWESTGIAPIVVGHPSYPTQRHELSVYRVAGHPNGLFAAGEYSNQVWGVFVPAS